MGFSIYKRVYRVPLGMKILCQLLRELLGLIIVANTHVRASDNCNAIYANSAGKCTALEDCPYLFDLIRSPHTAAQDIVLLQDLTCQKNNDNPLVCCSLNDINSESNNELWNFQLKQSSKLKSFYQDSIPQYRQSQKYFHSKRQCLPKPSAFSNVHPNFRLLPTIDQCGTRVNSDRIAGGEPASILEFPWLARIQHENQEDGTVQFTCAGTVISKRYILTAAHCVEELNESVPTVVRIAERDKTCDHNFGCWDPVDINIEKVITHREYNKKNTNNDIALIRLTEDIKFTPFTQPVCMPFVEEYGLRKDVVDPSLAKYFENRNMSAVVGGWGKTRWNAQSGSDFLQYAHVPVISPTKCQSFYPHVHITEKQLCAGGQQEKRRMGKICQGDSGGGLFIQHAIPTSVNPKHKRAMTFQYGIVSFGPTYCGVGDVPGVFINIYAFKQWILNTLEP